ncbi:MAG: hypothetical protein KAX49_17200 [Halanaerobiales bacterium]|nr:hypothetical protein [Halanaerobiales bacterium]
MKYFYFVAKGQHDIAAIGKMLTINRLKLVREVKNLDKFWRKTIQYKFPPKGDLLKRVPIPIFYQSDELSVAIQSGKGDTQLVKTLNASLTNLDEELLSGIAVFFDADHMGPQMRLTRLIAELNKSENDFLKDNFLPCIPGEVSNESLKTGVYVFPDNMSSGNLENLLLECASVSYKDILDAAIHYVQSFDKKYKLSESKQKKAIIGCIANVLKPGKANQVSIQDDNWFCQRTIEELESVLRLNEFIKKLLL